MITPIAIALMGTVITATGGCLLGVLLGRKSRRLLARECQQQARSIHELETLVRQQPTLVAVAQDMRDELRLVLEPLLAREHDGGDMQEKIREVLDPLMVHERRAQSLGGLPLVWSGRRELPALLEMVAKRGGFSAVLLSDEMGLPLAASAGARNTDVLAGVCSLIFTLADRVRQAGSAEPTAVLVRDAANQLILHRLFAIGGERYLVTAVSKGAAVSVDALDPTLAALEGSLCA
jgi:hypothetical protein